MYKSVLILFIVSIVLFYIGYNFAFNTIKMIAKYISLANYKEGSFFYKLLSSKTNILWMKIAGFAIIGFAFIIFILMMILIFKKG